MVTLGEEYPVTMPKFLFPRIHGPDHDLCIRSITFIYLLIQKSLSFEEKRKGNVNTQFSIVLREAFIDIILFSVTLKNKMLYLIRYYTTEILLYLVLLASLRSPSSWLRLVVSRFVLSLSRVFATLQLLSTIVSKISPGIPFI